MIEKTQFSLVIPVYKNEESIPYLIEVVRQLDQNLNNQLEIIFVVDGSPDASLEKLNDALNQTSLKSTLLLLSKNFGSFAAIRTGLHEAKGPYYAVMAADLQEPPELILKFFETLEKEPFDVVVGTREKREDSYFVKITSKLFWSFYRWLVQKDLPPNGVDVFGCNLAFRNHLLSLTESNSTLVGLLFWLGFRRKSISYQRLARQHGKSAWSFKKRVKYLNDSIFAFSDLPIKLMKVFGFVGILVCSLFAIILILSRINHWVTFPGYTATLLTIVFFSAINIFGLGIIGSYIWRTFENSKGRPASIVMHKIKFNGEI